MLAGLALAVVAKPSVGQQTAPDPAVWTVPEIGALPNDAHGRLVRRDRDLITATYALIGPLVANPAKRYAGNNPACASCRLQAATKMFGLPLFGLAGDYPRYNARSGTEITLVERLNACMTRSVNGRPLPANSPEMTAIVAYLQFLWSGVPPGRACPGSAPATRRNWTVPPIQGAASTSMPRAAPLTTTLTARAFPGSG